jgi:hypothetical protein
MVITRLGDPAPGEGASSSSSPSSGFTGSVSPGVGGPSPGDDEQ